MGEYCRLVHKIRIKRLFFENILSNSNSERLFHFKNYGMSSGPRRAFLGRRDWNLSGYPVMFDNRTEC